MASTKLCVQCKGYRRLCGRHICPILERFKFAKLASLRVGYSYYGPTPPSLLVGEYGYPRIPIGVNVVGEKSDTPAIYDSPGEWWGKLDINEVIRLRSTLIYSRTIHNVRRPLRLLETIQESIMSLRPVDLEVQYKKPPRPSIRFDGHLAPMGPSAPLKKLELVSNPYVPRKVDQLIYDTDVKASIAVMELYRSGLSVYPIVRILSAGLLGLKFQRRLVPTRWAITTVDVMIGDSLVKRVKGYPEIRDVELYYVEYIGNRYVILMVPGPYIYEVVEIWLPRGLWTEGSTKPSIIHNWEDFRGPQPGGVNDGGYYAARLPILEALDIFFNENLSEIQEILRDTFLEQVSGSVFFKKMDEPIKSAKWVTITIDYDMPGFSFFTRIDIQFLSSLPARVERKRIITEPYGGNSGYLNTLYLEDVFLDKLVALYDRTSAKDLWDLYFLLHNGVKISTPLSSVIDIPIGKLLLAIDFISDTDWKLLYNYIPRQLAFPTLYQVKNEIRDFVIKNWI